MTLRLCGQVRNNVGMLDWFESHQGLLAFIGVVVAVAAIPIAIVVTWRWAGGRRTKLIAGWTSVQMVTGGNVEGLEVHLKGSILDNPHLVTVALHNIGPNDITSSSFDNRAPLEVTVHGARAVELVGTHEGNLAAVLDADGATLHLGPGHIPAKTERSVVLLTEGEPLSVSFGDLVNVDVRCTRGTSVDQEALRLTRRTARTFELIATVAGAAAISAIAATLYQ